MAYHVQSDVEALLKQLNFTFTATSKITVSDATKYIADTDRYIDSRLANTYTVPVVDVEAKAILLPVAAQLTAAKCWRIIYAAQQGESNKAKEWESQSEKVLNMVIAKEMKFGAAAKAGSVNTPYSAMSESEAIWKMNTDQW